MKTRFQNFRKNAVIGGAACAGLLVMTGVRALAQSLSVNGEVASTGLKTINGRVYVPLSDVAKAFNQTIVKKSGGYALTPAGGAGEVGDAHQAKIGQTLFTGDFRFTVLDVSKTDSYQTTYGKHMTVTPSTGNSLYVVTCRIKNGTPQKQSLVLSLDKTYGNLDTSLTDDKENSYTPLYFRGGDFTGYDAHLDETYPDGSDLLPGAALNFKIVFDAPSDITPKALVFSFLKYAHNAHAKTKQVDVRVSLTP